VSDIACDEMTKSRIEFILIAILKFQGGGYTSNS
jgi:hypothetical protein